MTELYVLVVVMCLAANQTECVERPQPEPITKEYCLTQGLNLARIFMIPQHDWTMKNWRCDKKVQP